MKKKLTAILTSLALLLCFTPALGLKVSATVGPVATPKVTTSVSIDGDRLEPNMTMTMAAGTISLNAEGNLITIKGVTDTLEDGILINDEADTSGDMVVLLEGNNNITASGIIFEMYDGNLKVISKPGAVFTGTISSGDHEIFYPEGSLTVEGGTFALNNCTYGFTSDADANIKNANVTINLTNGSAGSTGITGRGVKISDSTVNINCLANNTQIGMVSNGVVDINNSNVTITGTDYISQTGLTSGGDITINNSVVKISNLNSGVIASGGDKLLVNSGSLTVSDCPSKGVACKDITVVRKDAFIETVNAKVHSPNYTVWAINGVVTQPEGSKIVGQVLCGSDDQPAMNVRIIGTVDPPAPPQTPADDKGYETYVYWQSVLKALKNAKDGDIIDTDPKYLDNMPTEIMDYLRNCGKSITLRLHYQGETFNINPKEAVKPEANRTSYTLQELLLNYRGRKATASKPTPEPPVVEPSPSPSPSPVPSPSPAQSPEAVKPSPTPEKEVQNPSSGIPIWGYGIGIVVIAGVAYFVVKRKK